MNVPNLLTLLRIFFVPVLVAALLGESDWLGRFLFSRETWALAIFLAAAVTDLLDGLLARRWGQVTTVGTLLDPIADKLLVDVHRVPAWMVILIIGREFAVSGLRSIAAGAGYTIEASELGKTKMVAQVVAIALVIGGVRWPALSEYGMMAMWAVVLFALVSAADYFLKFWRVVDTQVKTRRRRELLDLQRQQRKARRAELKSERKAAASPAVAPTRASSAARAASSRQ